MNNKRVKVWVEFLNPKKGFKEDKKYFEGDTLQNVQEKAKKWCLQTMEKFNPDYIKF